MNLNPNLYNLRVEQKAVRDGFGEGLVEVARENKQVVGLCADLLESTRMEAFAKEFPDRYVEVGVAEQNLVTVASGLASMGKIPFATSYAIFSPGRNWEHIRTTICYNNTNVKIIGSHAGLSVGADGGSHQMLEDIALARVLPRMTVIVPSDAIEAKKATIASAKIIGPVYLRLAREKTPIITTEETPFVVGKANVLASVEKPQAVIIACGPLVYYSLLAIKKLKQENDIEVTVINNHTIKPLDEKTLLEEIKKADAVVTVEEHQQIGGLGGAVAEMLAKNYPVPQEFIGVDDKFGESGSPVELLEHYGLGVDDIVEAVKKVIIRKGDYLR